jgi:hypothetical protein
VRRSKEKGEKYFLLPRKEILTIGPRSGALEHETFLMEKRRKNPPWFWERHGILVNGQES